MRHSRELDEIHKIRARKAGLSMKEILAECESARAKFIAKNSTV